MGVTKEKPEASISKKSLKKFFAGTAANNNKEKYKAIAKRSNSNCNKEYQDTSIITRVRR